MKIYFIITLIFVVLSCNTTKNESNNYFLRSKEYFKNKNYIKASSEIENAILLDSFNIDYQIMKAKILSELNNFELAIKILENVEKRNQKLDTVYFNIGNTYYRYGNHLQMNQNNNENSIKYLEKSIKFLNNSIDVNIKYFDAYVIKQKAFHNLGKYEEALSVANTALNIFSDNYLFISNRGIEKLYLGDINGALSDLDKSIKSGKLDSLDYATSYRFRSYIYMEKTKYKKAIDDLTKALMYNNKDSYAFFTRGECYAIMGINDKACNDFRNAADLGLLRAFDEIKKFCN